MGKVGKAVKRFSPHKSFVNPVGNDGNLDRSLLLQLSDLRPCGKLGKEVRPLNEQSSSCNPSGNVGSVVILLNEQTSFSSPFGNVGKDVNQVLVMSSSVTFSGISGH
jgi:hypothetical protein